ncbi:TPA: hypothetical protein DCX15_00355 [bacterium]|nr:hypothetical protein [bacterium]
MKTKTFSKKISIISLITLFSIFNTYQALGIIKDSATDDAKDYYFKYATFYEFYPDHIKVSHVIRLTGMVNYTLPRLRDTLSTLDLYSPEDIYNLRVSPNIKINSSRTSKDPYRGVVYKRWFYEIEVEKGDAYYLSYMVNRLPHFHTLKEIAPSKELTFTMNASWGSTPGDYKVFVFPSNTEIIEFPYLHPTKILDHHGFKLLIYDLSGLRVNAHIHIKFILQKDKEGSLDMVNIFNSLLEDHEVAAEVFYEYPTLPFPLKFIIPLQDALLSPPTIKEGCLYYVFENFVYGYDLSKGREDLKIPLDDYITTSPVIVEDKIFIGCADHKFYCLNRFSGKTIYEFKTRGYITTPPLYSQDQIFLTSCDGYVYALTIDGRLNWKYKLGPRYRRGDTIPIIMKDGANIYCSYMNRLYSFNKETGALNWRFMAKEHLSSRPIIVESQLVYSRDEYGRIYIIDLKTGECLKEIEEFLGIASEWNKANDLIIFGNLEGELSALKICDNGQSLEEYWSCGIDGLEGRIPSPIAVMEDKVIVDTASGMVAIDIEDGEIFWKYPANKEHPIPPAISEGFLVYPTSNRLLVFSLKNE